MDTDEYLRQMHARLDAYFAASNRLLAMLDRQCQ